MTAAAPVPRTRSSLAFSRTLIAGVILSVPVGMVMTAGASLIVALLAFPVAFLVTRDLYVTLLAPTYGLYAAGQALQWVCAATLVWSLLASGVRRWMRPSGARSILVSALLGGVGTILVWGCGIVLVQMNILQRWHYDPLADSALLAFLGFALSGALAGCVSATRRKPATAVTSAWRGDLRQTLRGIAWYAFALALALEAWITVAGALGWN